MPLLNVKKIEANRRNYFNRFERSGSRGDLLNFFDDFIFDGWILALILESIRLLLIFYSFVKTFGQSFMVSSFILKADLMDIYFICYVNFLFFWHVFDDRFGCWVIQLTKFSWLYTIHKNLHLW
jgi:hypothetical protein